MKFFLNVVSKFKESEVAKTLEKMKNTKIGRKQNNEEIR